MCGRTLYKFTDLESSLEITDFPHKGIIWDASTNQITLQPKYTDPTGLHKVLITAFVPNFKDVLETVEIAYLVHPKSDQKRKNEEQSEPDTGQLRRLEITGQGYCTNPTTMLNLLNTSALAEQNSFWPSTSSQTSSAGCDGEVMMINKATLAWDRLKLINSAVSGTSSAPQFWKVTFQYQTFIKTTLIINRDSDYTHRFPKFIATVGNNPDVTQNPICFPAGTMIDGGWHMCQNPMTGSVFGVYTTTDQLNFIEVMAFSQEAIQLKTGVIVSFIGRDLDSGLYPAINAIQKQVVLKTDDYQRQKCFRIYSPNEGLATLFMKFPAQYFIKAVVLIPGYTIVQSGWPINQKNVAIYLNTEGGTKKLCGVTEDYYSTTYYEVQCNFQANEIILVQQTPSGNLQFCGFGALADCNCNKSSFYPASFTTPQEPLVSTTSLQIKSTESVQTIQITQVIDTVSSSNGCVSCGPRSLSFKDKLTGLVITAWPYKGYNFDPITSKITLDPAQADAASVVTVTISLDNYPTVLMSQDITVIVQIVASPVPLFQIPKMTLNAMINQKASLQLPINDAYAYFIASKPTFTASIDGTQLQVHSTNVKDVGIKYLDLVAISVTNKVTFTVNVIFTSTLSSATTTSVQAGAVSTSSGQGNAVPTSSVSKPAVVSYSADDSQQIQSELISYLQKVECDESGSCVDPTNSRFSCYFDDETGKMVCGVDLVKKEKNKVTKKYDANAIISPTMEISGIDSKGFFTMKFSQSMNFSSLINETYSSSERTGSKEAGTNQTDFSKYLLSAKHIKISVLVNADQESPKLQLNWVVANITDRKIKIQVLFKNPTFISQDSSSPDFLVIKLLSPFLGVKSKLSNLIIINPLRTVKKRLPNQLVLGATAEIVEEAAVTVKTASQAVVIGNFILSVFLSGALGTMYLMINSFQMLMSYSFLVVPQPANVTLVMVQINTIASFDYLPTETLIGYIFEFSDTEIPFATFQAMGVDSPRLTLYLGTIFFILVLIFVLSIIFLISWPFKKTVTLVRRFHNMMRTQYYWRGIIRLLLESYSDMSIGIMLSWRESRFENASDVFDSVFTFFVTLIVIGWPILCCLLLLRYESELDGQTFQQTYGSLTEGYFTTGVLGCKATRYMILWFLLRRFLTAVSIVYLGDQSPVWQIASLMYLSLADVLVNYHLNAFESTARSIMAKVNDIVVFLLSYFPFVYSGLVLDPESRYEIGWFQVTLIGIMFLANVGVVIFTSIIKITQEFRRDKIEKYNFQKLKGMGYTMVIVVETIWQKLARLCLVEWVFYDSRPERLNVQITSYVWKLRHEKAEHLVDQLDELEFYEYQLDGLQFYQNARNATPIIPKQNQEIRSVKDSAVKNQMRQNQLSELLLTFGKPSQTSTNFVQRLPKTAFKQIMEEVFSDDKKENSEILEGNKTEFAVPLNKSSTDRVKISWLNSEITETRGNQVAQFKAGPQTIFKPRQKKQVIVPVKFFVDADLSKAKIDFKQAKENKAILCLEKIKASKQKMSVRFTDFVDLLPQNFLDLTPEAQLDEVDYLYNFLIQTDDKPLMQLQEDTKPLGDFSRAEEESKQTIMIEMQAKPAKKRIV